MNKDICTCGHSEEEHPVLLGIEGVTPEGNSRKLYCEEFVLAEDKEYGCPSCEFSSNNKEDFSYVEGDTLNYCKDCIKKYDCI